MNAIDTARAVLASGIRARLEGRGRARASLEGFLAWTWWRPWPLKVGRHTRAICARIDQAIADLRLGKSTFLLVAVPFRHGKSDLVSRALPPYFLARTADLHPDVILTGYGQDLVETYSRDCHAIIRSNAFATAFPKVKLSAREANVGSWALEGSSGRVTAAGLGGALTGKGAHLLIVDDYCKNRAEARSSTYRNRTWESFQDAMSRRAPASIVIVCATPWHVDDIRGRIRANMERDPEFPRFEELNFPAKNLDAAGAWDGTFLFEDRFPAEWYRQQYASQGSFAPALLDCDPQVEGGNRFQTERIDWRDSLEGFPNVVKRPDGRIDLRGYKRAWDLASSEKSRDSDDPDFTVGVKGFVQKSTARIAPGLTVETFDVWIADVFAIRAEAPARNDAILQVMAADGQGTAHHVEAFGAYKDTLKTLQGIVRGAIRVEGSKLPGDKAAKLDPLEPVFAQSRVHVLRGKFTELWAKHFREFPDGTHDDAADATAVLFHSFAADAPGIASREFFAGKL